MSQRTQALALLSPIGAVINVQTIRALREIVEDAQNGPPDGAADGSIDEALWNELKSIVTAGERMITAIENVGRTR